MEFKRQHWNYLISSLGCVLTLSCPECGLPMGPSCPFLLRALVEKCVWGGIWTGGISHEELRFLSSPFQWQQPVALSGRTHKRPATFFLGGTPSVCGLCWRAALRDQTAAREPRPHPTSHTFLSLLRRPVSQSFHKNPVPKPCFRLEIKLRQLAINGYGVFPLL